MCGISGAFRFGDADRPVDPAVVVRLNEHQRSRGPDGVGVWSSKDKRIALGHRRLAIIDTSASGAQPMSDASGRWVITFNGEIYNYRELRAELEQLGCQFHTASDTEVLISVVARWGETGLLKLRGMYAFALWDSQQDELWLARDPYGIKPLYIAERDGMLWFASQARALATCAPINTEPSPAAVVGFYLWGYVPEPHAWWAGARHLPAGHVLRVRAGHPLPAPVEFASIQDCYVNRPRPPLPRAELHAAMLQSVRRHLVADVPIGLFLSAGVDSTALAALAGELGGRLKTITLGFAEYDGTADDEAPAAEATARLLKTDHTTVRISHAQFEELLHEFLAAMDQPTTDGLNTYLVSRAAASQGLKVALSGLGGDELFGGYPSFRQIPTLLKWRRRLPALAMIGRPMQKLLRMAPMMMPPKSGGVLPLSATMSQAYLLRRALYLDYELAEVLDVATLRDGLEQLATTAAVGRAVNLLTDADATDYAKVAALESGWYMRNQLLRDADWAGMAHGLEIRVPYADFALLRALGPAIASSVPPTKQDLANCIPGLPATLAARPKTGFTTPVRDWIRQTTGTTARGLRGWAAYVDRQFRGAPTLRPRVDAARPVPAAAS